MLITPQTMLTRHFVKARYDQFPLEAEQSQQIGLDVRVGSIEKILGTSILMRNSKKLPAYVPIDRNQDNCWVLKPGAYAIETLEECDIHLGFEGKLIHRSTFNRSGVFLTGSVYDPGYKGVIAGTLYVHTETLIVEFGTRIGQFQMQTAEQGSAYNGDYQNQTSHAEAAKKLQ